MVDQPRYQSLRDYLAVIRRRRRLVVALTLLSVAFTLGTAIREDAVYQSESALSFREPSADLSAIGLPEFNRQLPSERATDNAERATRPEVLRAAERRLGFPVDGKVTARAETRTNFVVIQSRDGDAKRAQQIAEAVGESLARQTLVDTRERFDQIISKYRKRIRETFKLSTGTPRPGSRTRTRDDIAQVRRAEIEAQLARLETASEVTEPVAIVRRAQVPSVPVEPRPVRAGVLGLFIGLTIGLLAAFLRETLDQRLRGSRDIVEQAQLPLLGVLSADVLGKVLPGSPGVKKKRELTELDLEPFRILRTNLDFLDVDRDIKSVVVTSPLPSEGKSTVAAALAVVAVLAGKRVLLIEGDMRRPVLAARFGVEPTPGLTDFLAGRAAPDEVMRTVPLAGDLVDAAGFSAAGNASLVVIPAGTPAPRPAELISSERFAAFATDVSSVYDLVIYDTCPLLPVVDTLEIIRHADAVILAVRSDQTTREQLRAAKLALERLPARPTGLVVTGVKHGADDGAYSYSYSYAYDNA